MSAVRLDPTAEYRQVTVRLHHKGVTLRRIVRGGAIQSSRQFEVRSGQLVLSRIDARNGAIGLVPAELDGAIVTNDFWLFDIDERRLLPGFVDAYVGTARFVEQCQRASEGTTNRVRLQPSRFLQIQIPLPSLEDQRQVVQLLQRSAKLLDEAENLRKDALAAREAMRGAIGGELLRRKPDWMVTTIEAVCETIVDNLHRNPIYADEGVPCVRSPDVGWGELNLASALRTDEAEYRNRTIRGEPRVGDVVLVREGGGTGKAAIVRDGQRFSLGQRVVMLRPNPEIVIPDFFLEQLLAPVIQEKQVRPRILGSASPHLNIGALRRFQFLLPPLEMQRSIVARFVGLRSLLRRLQVEQVRTASEIAALRRTVIARAFSGELVRIRENSNGDLLLEEPAI